MRGFWGLAIAFVVGVFASPVIMGLFGAKNG